MAKDTKDKSVKKQQVTTWGETACRNCGSTNHEPLGELPRTDQHVIMDDGRRYTAVIRSKVQCNECGNVTNLMRFEYDPAAWVE